jgi:cystathionine gamma-lyase
MEKKEQYAEYIREHEETFKDKGFGTKLIHCGQEPDFINGSMTVPIGLSTTYAQYSPGVPFGNFDYSRCGNPTREHLERQVAAIENGKYCIAFSSGCAVCSAVIQMIRPGEEVICIDDVYGGTQRMFRRVSSICQEVKFIFTPMDDLNVVKGLLTEKTKLVWLESPTNPTLKMTDIPELVKLIKGFNENIIVVCDNTFLSPYNCKPLDFGVDVVVESATKYMGGHSDVVMGLLTTNSKELHEKLYFIAKTIGGCPSPFDCYLLMRGLKTLHLRMERVNLNAMKIAEYLENHKNVEKVYYPGLESSPYNSILKKVAKGCGGVISLKIKGDMTKTLDFIKDLKIFTLAESLGAVESLLDHPATMTHGSVPPEIRKELGIDDNFIRLSVGCEDLEDLIADLEYGLSRL